MKTFCSAIILLICQSVFGQATIYLAWTNWSAMNPFTNQILIQPYNGNQQLRANDYGSYLSAGQGVVLSTTNGFYTNAATLPGRYSATVLPSATWPNPNLQPIVFNVPNIPGDTATYNVAALATNGITGAFFTNGVISINGAFGAITFLSTNVYGTTGNTSFQWITSGSQILASNYVNTSGGGGGVTSTFDPNYFSPSGSGTNAVPLSNNIVTQILTASNNLVGSSAPGNTILGTSNSLFTLLGYTTVNNSNNAPSIINPKIFTGNIYDTNYYVKVVQDAWGVTSNYTTAEISAFLAGGGYGHIQGIAFGSNQDFFVAMTIGLFKFSNNLAWSNGATLTLLASNTTAQGTVLPGAAHYGDLKCYNGLVYATSEIYSGYGLGTSQSIAVFKESDLSYVKNAAATNENLELSGLCIIPTLGTNGVIACCSYCTNNPAGDSGAPYLGTGQLRLYDLATLAYEGDFYFAHPIEGIQGICWSTNFNRFIIAANPSFAPTYTLYTVDLYGRVIRSTAIQFTLGAFWALGQGDTTFEGLDIQGNNLLISYFNAANLQRVSSFSIFDTNISYIDHSGYSWNQVTTANKVIANNEVVFPATSSFDLGSNIIFSSGNGLIVQPGVTGWVWISSNINNSYPVGFNGDSGNIQTIGTYKQTASGSNNVDRIGITNATAINFNVTGTFNAASAVLTAGGITNNSNITNIGGITNSGALTNGGVIYGSSDLQLVGTSYQNKAYTTNNSVVGVETNYGVYNGYRKTISSNEYIFATNFTLSANATANIFTNTFFQTNTGLIRFEPDSSVDLMDTVNANMYGQNPVSGYVLGTNGQKPVVTGASVSGTHTGISSTSILAYSNAGPVVGFYITTQANSSSSATVRARLHVVMVSTNEVIVPGNAYPQQ